MITTYQPKKYFTSILILSILSSMLQASDPNTVTGLVGGVVSFTDPSQIVFAPNTTKAYIINDGTVTVIDTDANETTHDVDDSYETFDHASCLAVTPDGTTLYAGNYYYASVLIIDTATDIMTGAVTDTNDDIDYPISLSMTTDGTTLYCLNGSSPYNIIVIDVATNTVTDVIAGSVDFSDPLQIVVSPDGTKAYVVDDNANSGNGGIFVVDLVGGSVTGQVTDSGSAIIIPYALVFTPDGLLAFVANNEGNAPDNTGSVVVIDVASDTVINDIIDSDFRYPQSISILPSGLLIYMTDDQSGTYSQGSTWIIDPVTQEVVGTVDDTDYPFNGPVNMGISTDGEKMYVVNTDDETVAIVFTIIPILPPTDLMGEMIANNLLTQIDLVNKLSWIAPTTGTTPALYKIYQDSGLTKQIGVVAANVLEFFDHNQQYGTTSDYYVTSVDGDGNESTAAHIAIIGTARPATPRR